MLIISKLKSNKLWIVNQASMIFINIITRVEWRHVLIHQDIRFSKSARYEAKMMENWVFEMAVFTLNEINLIRGF